MAAVFVYPYHEYPYVPRPSARTNHFESLADELIAYLMSFLDRESYFALAKTCRQMWRMSQDVVVKGTAAMRYLTIPEILSREMWWTVCKYFHEIFDHEILLKARKRDKYWRILMERTMPDKLKELEMVENEELESLNDDPDRRNKILHVLALGLPHYVDKTEPKDFGFWIPLVFARKAWWVLDKMAARYSPQSFSGNPQWVYDLMCWDGIEKHIVSLGSHRSLWSSELMYALVNRRQFHLLAKYKRNWIKQLATNLRIGHRLGQEDDLCLQVYLGLPPSGLNKWEQFTKLVPWRSRGTNTSDWIKNVMAMPKLMEPDSAVAAIQALDNANLLTQDVYDSLMGDLLAKTMTMKGVNHAIALGSKHGLTLGIKSARGLGETRIPSAGFVKIINNHIDPSLHRVILAQGCHRAMVVNNLGHLVSEDFLREVFAKYQDFHQNNPRRRLHNRIDKCYRDLLPTLFSE